VTERFDNVDDNARTERAEVTTELVEPDTFVRLAAMPLATSGDDVR
jgi:hypothetical protein